MGIQSVTPAGSTAAGAAQGSAPPEGTAPAVDPAATTGAEVDIKPEELGRWSKLHRENRENRAKLAEWEPRIAELDKLKPEAEKATKLGALVGEKKWIEAMTAAGIDPEAAFEAWVQASQEGAAPAPSKELIELQAWKAEQEKKDKEATAAGQTAAQQAAVKQFETNLVTELAKPDAKWTLCAAEANRAQAATDARLIATEVARKWRAENGNAEVPDEMAGKMIAAAFDQVEEAYQFEEWRKSRTATTADSRDTTPRSERVASSSQTITSDRGTLRRPPVDAPKYATFKEVKAELLAKQRKQ